MQERLKIIRKTLNLKQGAFAEKLGITQAYLSEIEKGKKSVSATVLLSLDALRINLHWFITGRGEMFFTEIDHNQNSNIATAIQLLSALPEDKQKECINFIQERKLLLDLQEQGKK